MQEPARSALLTELAYVDNDFFEEIGQRPLCYSLDLKNQLLALFVERSSFPSLKIEILQRNFVFVLHFEWQLEDHRTFQGFFFFSSLRAKLHARTKFELAFEK